MGGVQSIASSPLQQYFERQFYEALDVQAQPDTPGCVSDTSGTSKVSSEYDSSCFDESHRRASSSSRGPARGSYTHIDTLTYKQVIGIRPPETYFLNLKHLAVLWVLDSNHDGVFTLAELLQFAEYCNEEAKLHPEQEFTARTQANCSGQFWLALTQKNGISIAMNWIISLIQQGHGNRMQVVEKIILSKFKIFNFRVHHEMRKLSPILQKTHRNS